MTGIVTEKEWQDGMNYARALASKFASFRNCWEEQEDLLSECYLGLHHAATLFDPQRGAKFTTYARYWMDQRMLRWHMSYRERKSQEGPSLDERVGEDGDMPLGDLLLDPSLFPEELLLDRQLIAEVWGELPVRDQEYLYWRFWQQETLIEIAERYQITRQRVDQVIQRGLKRLRYLLARRLRAEIPPCLTRRD